MQFVIKKHKLDPFRLEVDATPTVRNNALVGYLADVSLYSLNYCTVSNKKFATRFTLYHASLLVAKLNKLNLLFYELEEA